MPAAASSSSIELTPLRRDSSRYAPSVHSSDTSASTTAVFLPSSSFEATTSLQIQSGGKALISLPLPPRELTVPIFSVITSRPVYLSIRATRRSGSCRLVDAEDETGTSIARTTYWFGPGRNPRVSIGGDDDPNADIFEMIGECGFTRTVHFKSRKWGKFQWRYCGKKERQQAGENVHSLLVLEKIIDIQGAGEERTRLEKRELE